MRAFILHDGMGSTFLLAFGCTLLLVPASVLLLRTRFVPFVRLPGSLKNKCSVEFFNML